MSNFDEFKRSLDQLVNQAQQTAQLGLEVARDQIETVVRNPNMNEQVDEVRRNLQTMARDIETKAQELVHLATTYVSQGPGFPGAGSSTSGQPPRSQNTTSSAGTEPPAEGESHTAAGAGTPQNGSDTSDSDPTHAGEAPKQQ